MSRVRLVGGPAGGKVLEESATRRCGPNEIIVRVPRKMTRKRKIEIMTDPNYYPTYYASAQGTPGSWRDIRMIDGMVEARYRMSVHPHFARYQFPPELGMSVHNIPCMHPDGSVFYEYIEGSKRDLSR